MLYVNLFCTDVHRNEEILHLPKYLKKIITIEKKIPRFGSPAFPFPSKPKQTAVIFVCVRLVEDFISHENKCESLETLLLLSVSIKFLSCALQYCEKVR